MVTFTGVVAGAEERWSLSRLSTCGPADEILATNKARNSPVTGRNRGNMVEALRSPTLLLVRLARTERRTFVPDLNLHISVRSFRPSHCLFHKWLSCLGITFAVWAAN